MTNFSFSATVDELNSSMADLSSQISALNKEIDAYNKQIANTQGEAKTLKSALASLEIKKNALLKQIDKVKLQIKEAEGNIKVTEGQISFTESKINENSTALAEIIKNMDFKERGSSEFLEVFTNTKSLSDIFDIINRENDITKAVNSYVRSLETNKNDLSIAKTNYETKKQTLVSLNSTLSDQKSLIDQTSIQKNQLLIDTKNKESNYQKLLADRNAKKDALEAELNDIESKLLNVTDITKLPKPGAGVLAYPLDTIRITQYFGNTSFAKSTGAYAGKGHNGIDFAASVGTPVYAAKTGVVLGTGNTDLACKGVSYGKWILLKHANGLTTLYGHLSVINVSAGQVVNQGDKIALSGDTGFVTGPHLHFTVFASDAVHITGPTEYKSKVCGTYLIMPVSPFGGYLNPLLYLE